MIEDMDKGDVEVDLCTASRAWYLIKYWNWNWGNAVSGRAWEIRR